MLAQVDPPSWGVVWLLLVGGLVLLVFVGWLVIDLAKKAADGRLGRNGIAGIRTKATRASDEAWLAAHKAGLKRSVLAGRILMGSGIAAALGLLIGYGNPTRTILVWGIRTILVWGIVVSVLPLVALAPAVMATTEGDRAAKAVARDLPADG